MQRELKYRSVYEEQIYETRTVYHINFDMHQHLNTSQ